MAWRGAVIIGIHPDRIGNESYSDKWIEFLQARGVEVRILNLLAQDALEQARICDGVMWRWAHRPQDKQSAQRILYAIEHYLKIPVYPNSDTSWHFDEKVAQYYLLKTLGAPMPRTWVFWDITQAVEWIKTSNYPLIYKLSAGAGSANVIRVDNKKQAAFLIRRAFRRGTFPWTVNKIRQQRSSPFGLGGIKSLLVRIRDSTRYVFTGDYPALPSVWWKPEYGYVYFQEFLPDNQFDTRITVIGERAFGFRRLNRPGDFRASGSGLIEYAPNEIDPRCIEIAFHVSSQGRFQSMAFDFLYYQDSPVIVEISYGYADWAVQACPGHWTRDLRWVPGHMWPEEAQIEDFLAYTLERK
jgi:glutathione synthase/RimK-type ligase-like ATP-grasp enzyme